MLVSRPVHCHFANLKRRGVAVAAEQQKSLFPSDLMLTKRSSLALLGLMIPSIATAATTVPTSSIDEEGLPLSRKQETDERKPEVAARKVPYKVVHFVRHGEGFHNIGFDEVEDTPLTHRGWADAEALRAHIDALEVMGNPLQCELVVVSPLWRTLETASAAFGGPFVPATLPLGASEGFASPSRADSQPSSNGNGSMHSSYSSAPSYTPSSAPPNTPSNSNPPSRASSQNFGQTDGETCSNDGSSDAAEHEILMKSQTAIHNKITAHDAIAVHNSRPFLAVEEVRERMSVHRCDRRRNLSITREHFPGVDFHLIKHDEDILWDEKHTQSVNEGARGSRYLVAEKTPSVIERGNIFMKWLMKRPEKHIAVVAHREILLNMLRTVSADAPEDVQKQLSKGFNHCEMRSVVFAEDGTPIEMLQDTYYPGGVARLWLFPVNWAKQKAVKTLASLKGR